MPQESDKDGQLDLEWTVVKQMVEQDRRANRWDSASRRLEELALRHPEIRRSPEYQIQKAMIEGLREEADRMYRDDLRRAGKLTLQGRLGKARETVDSANLYYPERKDEVWSPVLPFLAIGGGMLLALLIALVHRCVGGAKT